METHCQKVGQAVRAEYDQITSVVSNKTAVPTAAVYVRCRLQRFTILTTHNVCVCMYAYAYAYVCMYMYVCMYVYMYVCMPMCVYVFVCVLF